MHFIENTKNKTKTHQKKVPAAYKSPLRTKTAAYGFAITGHDDLWMGIVESLFECMEKCALDNKCNSFDFGARYRHDCHLSTATRVSVTKGEFTTWPLYDYYEKKQFGDHSGELFFFVYSVRPSDAST